MERKYDELRILFLEDVPSDAELTEHELRRSGIPFSSKRVETREGFMEAIRTFRPDLILADHRLPAFDGLSALEIVRSQCPDVPFIFVTGAMGEEWAIDTLKRGATDYVLKDRLSRLVPAVKRALREAEEHRQRRKAEAALKRTTEQLKNIFDNIDAILFSVDLDKNKMLQVSPACERICGLPQGAFIANPNLWLEMVHPDDQLRVQGRMRHLRAGKTVEVEYRFVRSDGNTRWVRGKVNPTIDDSGNLARLDGFLYDITERKKAERELQQSEFAYRTLAENLPAIVCRVLLREGNKARFFNEHMKEVTGYAEGELGPGNICSIFPLIVEEDRERVIAEIAQAMSEQRTFSIEYRIRHKNGEVRCLIEKGTPVKGADGDLLHIDGVIFDITERKLAEDELRQQVEELERFRKATIQREFRIKELKDQLDSEESGKT